MSFMGIMGAKSLKQIPMEMLLPHERQALKNHGQSLHRLAERGGLGCNEALAILEGTPWGKIKTQPDDEARLTKLVEEFDRA